MAEISSDADAAFSIFEKQIDKLKSVISALALLIKKRPKDGYVKLLSTLSSYQNSILILAGSENFGESTLIEIASILERGGDSATAGQLREAIPNIRLVIPPRNNAKKACLGLLMRNTNAFADIAQNFIKAEELRDQGMPENEIIEYVKTHENDNIFK